VLFLPFIETPKVKLDVMKMKNTKDYRQQGKGDGSTVSFSLAH
jgi:predicted ATPase